MIYVAWKSCLCSIQGQDTQTLIDDCARWGRSSFLMYSIPTDFCWNRGTPRELPPLQLLGVH
ncbi:unnamed protein product, partial [Amoebophrya sp. A25]|eukprot:GSA25T00027056001.1